MRKRPALLILMLLVLMGTRAQDTYNQIDDEGNISRRSENGNFNKHNNDTTRNKEIPKGFHVWNINRKFGDVIPTVPDTIPHLFMNTTFNSGLYGEYNHTGSNYTARQSRIFFNRPVTEYFIFTQPYSFIQAQPDKFHFMNTLSPYTSILYNSCGDKTDGEDRIDAKFFTNINKRVGIGFELDYAYARGFYSNQSISHFNGNLFGYYLGDRYNMHVFFTAGHQKASENGGITDDEYITHPESYEQSFNDNEIPTVLSKNWNRNDQQRLFLSHRYNIGFYKKVKMTEEEIKAKKFAEESKKEREERNAQEKDDSDPNKPNRDKGKEKKPMGRPEGAIVKGAEPVTKADTLAILNDTTRIKVDGQAAIDSLNRAQAIQDSIDATMKRIYVPVTSIIHTLELNNYKHVYQAYETPDNYYLNSYYSQGTLYGNDSIYDNTKHLQIKNTFALALLEGFNKYVKAGLKGFISYENCTYQMPDTLNSTAYMNKWSEYNFSFGGQLSKTQGKLLHFNLLAETWVAGANAGDFNVDFNADLNFPLFKDTVQVAGRAYIHSKTPVFFQSKYHSKHLWWDNDDMSHETRSRIEGTLSYQKTKTSLRVGIENIKNYTYFGMKYDATTTGRQNMTANVYQASENISVFTAQVKQDFRLGPIHWDNIITYQNSSNKTILPLPDWNFFTNLFLKFRIAKVLGVELGADLTWFSKYYAPDFCPMINQFAIQQTEDSRVELGEYPFVDVYANLALKGVRFFVMMTNIVNGSGNHMKFLAPHYPTNGAVLNIGISWPFFN